MIHLHVPTCTLDNNLSPPWNLYLVPTEAEVFVLHTVHDFVLGNISRYVHFSLSSREAILVQIDYLGLDHGNRSITAMPQLDTYPHPIYSPRS